MEDEAENCGSSWKSSENKPSYCDVRNQQQNLFSAFFFVQNVSKCAAVFKVTAVACVIVPPRTLPANCQSPTLVVCKHWQPCLFWTRPSRINMKPDPTEPGLDFLLQTRQSDAWRILIAGWAEPTFHPWSLNLILERWSPARDSDGPEGKSWNHKRTISSRNHTLKLASISFDLSPNCFRKWFLPHTHLPVCLCLLGKYHMSHGRIWMKPQQTIDVDQQQPHSNLRSHKKGHGSVSLMKNLVWW